MKHLKTNEQKQIASKTMAMKSEAFNAIRQLFNPKNELSKTIKNEDKIELINNLIAKAHFSLLNYKSKRQYKNEIKRLRVERGWVPKKKTSYKEWLEMVESKRELIHHNEVPVLETV